jgi:cyanophycin synthetase
MEIVETQVYGGASYWAPVPVIRFLLEIGELEEQRTNRIPGFYEKLAATLPTMHEHQCSAGKGEGFFERVREGVSLSHVTEHTALELQNLAGQKVGNGHACPGTDPRGTARAGVYHLIFPYQEPAAGIAAGKLAIRLMESFVWPERDPGFDFARQLAELIHLTKGLRHGIDTRMLSAEAELRGIPVERLDDNRGRVRLGRGSRPRLSLLQLGHGRFQKRIWAPYISTDGFIAAEIAFDKELTNRLLRNAGLPVPRAISVTDEDAAVAVAREIGYPVVLKPLDSSQGRGVGVGLEDDVAVRAHYPLALRETESGRVLIEAFVTGRHYRILVVGGRFVAAAERVPAHVTGDGSHALHQLIDLSNADPRRGYKHRTRIGFDVGAIALAQEQGYGPDDIVPPGKHVQLALTANISTGGTSIDCTDEIHPYNVAIAEQAALVIGLDVAGIDLITPHIAQSVLKTGGAICEVNGGPGLFVVHTQPDEGQPRDVMRPVIELLFPPGAPSRIPIVAVSGTNGTTITSWMIAHILKTAGRRVGLATSDGIYINGMRIVQGDMSGPESARMVLRNPAIDAAVLETGHEGILRSGLGYDRADVAVITNVSGEHVGLPGIDTLQDLARLNAVVATSASGRGTAVLNAEDVWCVQIAGETHGKVIYFSRQPDNQVLECHLQGRGRALVLGPRPGGEALCLVDGTETSTVVLAQEIPATSEGRDRFNISNALAAAAGCLGLGINLEYICQGLRTFAQG